VGGGYLDVRWWAVGYLDVRWWAVGYLDVRMDTGWR